MKFIIRNKIFECCFELEKFFIVQNIDDFVQGDYIVASGVVCSNSITTNIGYKIYYLVSKKTLQVYADFIGFNVWSTSFSGKLKYGKANYVIAKVVDVFDNKDLNQKLN